MQKQLPQSFLGKTVHLDQSKSYTIKYQDNRNNDGAHVLLFDDDKPVIFAVMRKDGSFKEAHFINKKSNHASVTALNRYNRMIDRKAKMKLTQDELKDALRHKDDAKMKNENTFKHLVDEHLEDISNGWPSRLLHMQISEFKSDESLIITSLKEALKQANPQKSLYYLNLHRYDELLPELTHHLSNQNNLLEKIFECYQGDELLFTFLKKAANTLPLTDIPLIQGFLTQTYSFDCKNKTHFFKPLFLLIYKRVKNEQSIDTKNWLNLLSKHSLLKQAIKTMTKN